MDVVLNVFGVAEAQKRVEHYRSEQDKRTRAAIRRGGQVVATAEKAALGPPGRLARGRRKALVEAKKHVPGTLYRSIRPNRPRRIGPGQYQVSVGPSRKTFRYRGVQESGQSRSGEVHAPPKRYVAVGVAAAMPLVRAEVEKKWREARI